MNGYLNFSDPDPISHCYDQLLNNDNATNNNGGGNDNNNLNNNSSFTNVWGAWWVLFFANVYALRCEFEYADFLQINAKLEDLQNSYSRVSYAHFLIRSL